MKATRTQRSFAARVRAARATDLAALLAMMKPFNENERIPWRPKPVGAALRRLLSDRRLGVVLVAEGERGALAGYVVATFGYDLEFAGRDAFVTELFVRAAQRRSGLGKALLEAVTSRAFAAGAGAVHLLVRPENREARALYERHAFELVPRLIMTRKTKPSKARK